MANVFKIINVLALHHRAVVDSMIANGLSNARIQLYIKSEGYTGIGRNAIQRYRVEFEHANGKHWSRR